MNHVIFVYLFVFTAALVAFYMILQRYASRPIAFVAASALSVAFIWALYGFQEGANFDMNFQNMFVSGEFQMQADARPQDATRFRLQPGINFQSGRVTGSLIQAL
jgi:hypothetical protein